MPKSCFPRSEWISLEYPGHAVLQMMQGRRAHSRNAMDAATRGLAVHRRNKGETMLYHDRPSLSAVTIIAAFCFFALAANPTNAQVAASEVRRLRAEAVQEGWTFKVDESEITKAPRSALCGLVEPDGWKKAARFMPMPQTLAALPASFDWRSQGAGLPPIRNQGNCGSCWAFASVGALECAIQVKGGGSRNLSEQWLVSCNRSGWGCGGGWFAHDYHVLNAGLTDRHGQNGAPYETDFSYQSTDASCGGPYPHRYWIRDWSYIGSQSGTPSVDQIKQAILTYGPVACAIYVGDAFQAYSGGIYNFNDARTINHAVVLVGWNDNNGEGYWILRNSWGTGWGEGGYMRIRYGCNNVGYAASYVVFENAASWQVTPMDDFTPAGPTGGPFTPSCMTFTVNNYGASAISWAAQTGANWLTITPSSGSVPAAASRTFNVCVNAAANTLSGYYEATITVTNITGGGTASRRASIRAGVVDAYTEPFESTGNDSDYIQYLFTPAGNGYSVCRRTISALPTSVTTASPLYLGDDDYLYVALAAGKTVRLFGQTYSSLWINSNGSLTFSAGDTEYTETPAEHFAMPRIAALFDDLDPSDGGQVYAQQLNDRCVVTWVNVPEYAQPNVNTFQMELFFDGRIQLSFLRVDAPDGILGLSAGRGVPAGFVATDFSSYPSCSGTGASPAIEANGSGSAMVVSQGTPVAVRISMDPGSAAGTQADWWVLARNSGGAWYRYDRTTRSWKAGIAVTFQGALMPVAWLEVLNSSTLPPGTYTFYFAVDTLLNALVDMDHLIQDSVQVTVQ